MPKTGGTRAVLYLCGPFVAALFFLAGAGVLGADKPAKPDGRQVFETKCLHCHKREKFTSQQHDRREWEQILSRMELNTCKLTEAEAKAVMEFLVKEHGY